MNGDETFRADNSKAEHSNRSFMYKSKSGNHLNATNQRLNNDSKRNRTDRRFEAFQMNRIIEPTPRKEKIAISTDEGIGTLSNIETNGTTITAKPQASKQRAFLERFGEYMKNKRQKQMDQSKPKPFVSAVRTGKFIDPSKDEKIVIKKKLPAFKPDRIKLIQKAIPICDTPHHRSPINTRSKKLNLVPMMSIDQLTPKRKKRKSIGVRVVNAKSNALTNNARPGTNVRRVSLSKVPKTRATNTLADRTTSGAIRKVMKVSQPAKLTKKENKFVVPTTAAAKNAPAATSNAQKVALKSTFVKPVKKAMTPQPSTSKQADMENKKPNRWQLNKTPKIPERFQFGPSSFNGVSGVIASTAVKPKKSTIPSVREPKNVFNESISPIENILEENENKEKSSSKKRTKLTKTPTAIVKSGATNQIGIDFVSPFVKLSRKIQLPGMPKTKPDQEEFEGIKELPKTPIQNLDEELAKVNYVSPFVTIARGCHRRSKHTEEEARKKKYSLESRKSLDFNESIEDRQKKEAAKYFRLQVERETKHFNDLIDEWIKYLEENRTIYEECVERIDAAVGMTRLLLRSKFKQFSVLVDQCENQNVDPPIKPEDLEGFWSMVYLQVDNCNIRFDKLKEWKENEWKDPIVEIMKQKKIRTGSGINKNKSKTKRTMSSSLAKMIMAARQGMKDKNAEPLSDDPSNIMVFNKRKSFLDAPHLNDSKTRRTLTPNKTPWIVSVGQVSMEKYEFSSIFF